MTNPTPHGQVPEALAHERDRAIMEGERNASLDAYSRVVLLTSAESRLYEAAFTNGWDRCAAHVQKPAKNEHVAGDVSKNGPESNMPLKPAPSAAVALSDDLRDRLVAISEAVADQDDRAAQAMLREILKAPQPSTTPQADSVLEDAEREVLMEHSGCGGGTQVGMLTVRLNPGDKVVMFKGRITQAVESATRK